MEAVRKEDEPLPTLSVGIGISHFLEPMRGALDLARKAEKLAKETRGALAVILEKRSGPPLQVSGRWGKLDEELKEFTRMHRGDLVPDRAAYELQELEHLTMRIEKKEDLDDFKRIARAEAERILRRKQPSHGAKAALAKEILEHLQGALAEYPPRELADRLIVARLLAQAEDQAGVELVLPQEEKP
jgi:CRISPR/Cas system-associated protein Cas10 (large subunit of type III CRISPR-Cas system)